jgi:capsular polysaccharide transport system permease protein
MVVRDYLLARESISELDRLLGLREHYRSGDALQAFPAWFEDATLEQFYEYLPKMATLNVDPQSGVASLRVKAFTPELALSVNETMLVMARERIKALNEQIRKDTLGIASVELAQARQRQAKAEEGIYKFRKAEGVMDPERQATLELQSEQEMRGKAALAEARLKQAQTVAPLSPMVKALQAEVASLQAAVASSSGQVVGAKTSRAAGAERYTALAVERDVAARAVVAAEEALIRARIENERRHLYLEEISRPMQPDGPFEPRRVRGISAVALIAMLLWGVVSLLGLGSREHRRGAA